MPPEIIALLTIGCTLLGALGGAYFRGRKGAHSERDSEQGVRDKVEGARERIEDYRERDRDRLEETRARYREEVSGDLKEIRKENREILDRIGEVSGGLGKVETRLDNFAKYGSGKHEEIRGEVMVWLDEALRKFEERIMRDIDNRIRAFLREQGK